LRQEAVALLENLMVGVEELSPAAALPAPPAFVAVAVDRQKTKASATSPQPAIKDVGR
jgi:hypothetical protein